MISLIVAFDKNKGIGKDNKLPWKSSKDMSIFVEKTKNSIVIMGRNTWDSLWKKPLKNRCNIVVSKKMLSCDDCFVCFSLEEACYKAGNNAIIIGGAQIYKKALEMNVVEKMFISEFKDVYDCDTFFPKFEESDWEKTNQLDFDEFNYYELNRKNLSV